MVGPSHLRGIGMASRLHRIDMDTFMLLLDTIEKHSRQENMTATRLIHFSLAGLKQPNTLYRYLRYGLKRRMIEFTPVQNTRWGELKCYYPATCGDRLLQVWREMKKEEKDKNGNQR